MKHLSEEKYQRRKSLRITAGIIIICFGFAIAATLTGMGIKEVRENKLRYSPENRSAVYEQLRQEEARLLILKQELEAKLGTESSGVAIYGSDEETLDAISTVLSGFTSGYEDHAVVGEYCRLSKEYSEISRDSNSIFDSAAPYFIVAFFVMPFPGIIGGSIISMARFREHAAFEMQGTIPLVKEGMETMTPTIIGVKEEFARSKARMAAENADYYSEAFGKVAREVSKGINDGRGKSAPQKDFWEED